jgi:hypothetical protein
MPGKYRVTPQDIEPNTILPATETLVAEYDATTERERTPPKPVPPCHQEEKVHPDHDDNGGEEGGREVEEGGNPGAPVATGGNGVAIASATVKPMNGQEELSPVAGWHAFPGETAPGTIVANGYAISTTPEDRKPLQPGEMTCRVWIEEKVPVPLGPPGDDLRDFV